MKRNFVCIICPNSCNLIAELNTNDEVMVSGNKCKRGFDFALSELTHPVRSLTTTVKTKASAMPVLPVKTDGEIPKELIFEAMKALSEITITRNLNCGEIVAYDLIGTGCNVIATDDLQGCDP